MPKFSVRSSKRLASCHTDIQIVCNELIKDYDFSVLCGHRGLMDQMKAFNNGKSLAKFPYSKHNKYPSMAIDICPYPLKNWDDKDSFNEMGIRFLHVASMLKRLKIITNDFKWGKDFTGLADYCHFEIK